MRTSFEHLFVLRTLPRPVQYGIVAFMTTRTLLRAYRDLFTEVMDQLENP